MNRVRALMLAVCACSGFTSCGDRPDREDKPALRVVHTPGQPLAPRRAPALSSAAAARSSSTGVPTTEDSAWTGSFAAVRGAGYEGWLRVPTTPGAWRPTTAEIARMEARLPAAGAAAMTRGDISSGLDLATYARQYRGYLRDTRQVIEVRFFCASSRHLARRDARVTGGGSCFLHSAYDIAEARFLYWRENPAPPSARQ